MKFLFKDFAGNKLARVEKIKEGFNVEHLREGDSQDYIESLLTQPYITVQGGEEELKDGTVRNFTEEVEFEPDGPGFIDAIIADSFGLGLDIVVIK